MLKKLLNNLGYRIEKKLPEPIPLHHFEVSIFALKQLKIFNYVDVIYSAPVNIVRGTAYVACTYIINDEILNVIKNADFVGVLSNVIHHVSKDNRIRCIILNRNDVGIYEQYKAHQVDKRMM